VAPNIFEEEIVGFGVARRIQLPLRAAWAMSIHKSQGMSIEGLRINARRAFEDGQTYVAISRATSLEGLELEYPLMMKHIKVSRKAKDFIAVLSASSAGKLPDERPRTIPLWLEMFPIVRQSVLLAAGNNEPEEPWTPPGNHPVPCGCLASQRVVFTGQCRHIRREQWEKIVADHGGAVTGQVSRKTTLLVCCEGNSGLNSRGQPSTTSKKHGKAQALGISIIGEEDLWSMIEDARPCKRVKREQTLLNAWCTQPGR